MPLFDPTQACRQKGTQRMSRKVYQISVARTKICYQTPRHSGTKYIYYKQGTAKVRKYHNI